MTAEPTTIERIETLVREAAAFDGALTPAMRFHDDLALDSLDVVELVVAAEDAFGVELPDDDVDHIVTVGDLVALVDRRAAAH